MAAATSWLRSSKSPTRGCKKGGETAPRFRILTDVTGPFFTVVTEVEVESLAAWEGGFREAMNQPWMEEWFGRMMPLVESGRREFYNVVE